MLKKCAGWPHQDTAVGYYRIIQPLRFLKRQGLAGEVRTLPFTGESQTEHYQWSDKTFMEVCKDADALITTVLWKNADILKMLNLRKHFGLKWVVDLDDNIWASSNDNPATGQAEILRKNRELCLSLADGVTVSVPLLKELVGNFNRNIFVQPNGLDFKVWNPLKVKEKRAIRIGWRGAYGHKEDLELIEPVIKKIKEAYPKVQFVTFGYNPPFSDENFSWVSFQKYPQKLADMGIDIAIVPLIDSAFNRCKSNLGYLEWSALSVPTVYSPTENHKGLPGLAATSSFQWYESLAKLIEDPKLREKLGKEQNKYVKQHFDMKELVKPLATWLEELPRRTDLEP